MCRFSNQYFIYFLFGYSAFVIAFFVVFSRYLAEKARHACRDPSRYKDFWLLFISSRSSDTPTREWFIFPVDEHDVPIIASYREKLMRITFLVLIASLAMLTVLGCH